MSGLRLVSSIPPEGAPGQAVNTLRPLGRWAFGEPTESDRVDSAFEAKGARTFDLMIARAGGAPPAFSA